MYPEDSRQRLPLFVNPGADLAPQKNAHPGADSWFLVANVSDGDHEYGLLLHYVTRGPGEDRSTVTITDITGDNYVSDMVGQGTIKGRERGFEFESGNIRWVADDETMQLQATAEGGKYKIALSTRRKGPVFAYNATAFIPLFGKDVANWQYSFPIMETTGTLTIDGKIHNITGTSWFDRQWGPLPLEALASGESRWLWIAVRLSNGDVLALWSVTGSRDYDWVTIQHADGSYTVSEMPSVLNTSADLWTSAKSGRRWPARWTVAIPGQDASLEVTLTNLGQELLPPKGDTVSGPAIEATVNVRGSVRGASVTGQGFVELVSSTDFD